MEFFTFRISFSAQPASVLVFWTLDFRPFISRLLTVSLSMAGSILSPKMEIRSLNQYSSVVHAGKNPFRLLTLPILRHLPKFHLFADCRLRLGLRIPTCYSREAPLLSVPLQQSQLAVDHFQREHEGSHQERLGNCCSHGLSAPGESPCRPPNKHLSSPPDNQLHQNRSQQQKESSNAVLISNFPRNSYFVFHFGLGRLTECVEYDCEVPCEQRSDGEGHVTKCRQNHWLDRLVHFLVLKTSISVLSHRKRKDTCRISIISAMNSSI